MVFKIGDSVAIKNEIHHAKTGIDLSGWQGRIVEVEFGDDNNYYCEVEWDSITLQNMPDQYFQYYLKNKDMFDFGVFLESELLLAQSRDLQQDVEEMQDALYTSYVYYAIEEKLKQLNYTKLEDGPPNNV